MEGSVGAPPQRVCPHCARISYAIGAQCPYCGSAFRRRTGVTPWMLVATAAVVLICVALMLLIAGQRLDSELDGRVDEVNRRLDANFNKIREDVRKELEAQGGAVPPVTATPTPFAPTPTPTTDPGTEITPDPTTAPEITPDATATETPTEEIRP